MVEYTQFRQQTAAAGFPARTDAAPGGRKSTMVIRDLNCTARGTEIGVYQCFFRRRCGARPVAAVIES